MHLRSFYRYDANKRWSKISSLTLRQSHRQARMKVENVKNKFRAWLLQFPADPPLPRRIRS